MDFFCSLRLEGVKGQCMASVGVESVNNMFERCLVFMHRMPRVWLIYCKFLMDQHKITRTRKVLFSLTLKCLENI